MNHSRLFRIAPPSLRHWSVSSKGSYRIFRLEIDRWAEREFSEDFELLRSHFLNSCRGYYSPSFLEDHWPLIVRHSLPFLLSDRLVCDTHEIEIEQRVNVLAALIEMHTLSLTSLDKYLDGALDAKNESTVSPPIQSELGTVIESIQALYSTIIRTANRDNAMSGAIAYAFPVTQEVFGLMITDHRSRYSVQRLSNIGSLSNYCSPDSRGLRSSGYWEVMIRGRFGASGLSLDESLTTYLLYIRRLRQLSDERADIEDDAKAGLVTAPILALLDRGMSKREVVELISDVWRSRVGYSTFEGRNPLKRLLDVLASRGAFKLVDEVLGSEVERLCQSTQELAPKECDAFAPLSDQRISRAREVLL